MFLRVVKLCEVLGVSCFLFSCVHNLFLFIIVHVCAFLFMFVIVSMCVGFKSQDQRRSTKFNVRWSSMCGISSFRWAIPCPWPSSLGVFYLLMCFSWSWSVCDILTVACLLFWSMQDLDILCVHNLTPIWCFFMCVGSRKRNWWSPMSPLASSLGEQELPNSLL